MEKEVEFNKMLFNLYCDWKRGLDTRGKNQKPKLTNQPTKNPNQAKNNWVVTKEQNLPDHQIKGAMAG